MVDKGPTIRVRVPSSTMLFGEHAVLRGKRAIVAAIDRYLTLKMTIGADETIQVTSGTISYSTTLSSFSFPHELRFIEEVIRFYLPQLDRGFSIEISSDIPQTVGLASSAAVTVAMTGALESYVERKAEIDRKKVLRTAVGFVRKVQGGRGSGADVAAALFGGVISYRAQTFEVHPLTPSLPLSLFYSGSKMATPEVIRRVEEQEKRFPDLFRLLFETIEGISQEAENAIVMKDLSALGLLMNMAQGCMESLLVSTEALSAIIWEARALPTVLGAKISGSGLGDSVVVLGEVDPRMIQRGHYVEGNVTPTGIEIEYSNDQ